MKRKKKDKPEPQIKFVEQGKSTLSLLGMNRLGTSQPWMITLGSTSDKDLNDMIRWLNNHGGAVDERSASSTQFHTMTPSEIPSKIKPMPDGKPITLQHQKLKDVLENEPEKVQDMFEGEKEVPVYGGSFPLEEEEPAAIPDGIFLRSKDKVAVTRAQKESKETDERMRQEYEDSASFFVGDSQEDVIKLAQETERLRQEYTERSEQAQVKEAVQATQKKVDIPQVPPDLYYSIVIEETDDPEFFGVYVPDLPGCTSTATSIVDAVYGIVNDIKEHIEVLKELGKEVPKPQERARIRYVTKEEVERDLQKQPSHGEKEAPQEPQKEDPPTVLEKIMEFCESASPFVSEDVQREFKAIHSSAEFAAPESGKMQLQRLADLLYEEVGGENEDVNRIWNTIFNPEIAELAEAPDPEPAPPEEAEAQEEPTKVLTKEDKQAMVAELASKTMGELQKMQIDVLGVLSDPRYVVFQSVYSGIEQQRPPCCIEFNARCHMLGLNPAKIGGAPDKQDPNYIRCPSCTLLMEEEINPNEEMEFSPILLTSKVEPAQIEEKEKSMVSSADDSQFRLFLEVKGIDYPLHLFPADPELADNLRKQSEWYKAPGDLEDIANAIHKAKAWKTGVGRNITGWFVLTLAPATLEQQERGVKELWYIYQEPEAL